MGDSPRDTSAPQATIDPEAATDNWREHVVMQIRGCRVKFPDFQSLLAHWLKASTRKYTDLCKNHREY
ncbi:hypothetical protein PG996_008432 [Apiospora saccharicola]|uniref:Uncharacterized protein n=1 Tax=Apiospora saccharicola TaxID=335842 RepID=A0ABR1UXX3_9PEZI